MKERLEQAIKNKDQKEVKELLEAGAEVNSSILTLAIYIKSITIVKLLLPYCEDVNQLPEKLNDTPLMSAAWKGLDTVVKLLIEKGASVNKKNIHGQTALILAAMEGRAKTVKVLLENGADPNVIVTPPAGEFTALGYAKHYGFTEVSELLEQHLIANKQRFV